MSGFNYDTSSVHARYDRARALAPHVVSLWLDAIATRLPCEKLDLILDLGCGTGRFTRPLQRRFLAQVIGVDASHMMLSHAAATTGPRVAYVHGNIERLPFCDNSADMAFMSQVWHHVQNKRAAAAEIHRVLKPDSFLFIRNSTIESLDSCLYLRFFPGAREIDLATHPTRADLIRDVETSGMRLANHVVIHQPVDASLADYVERTALRGWSDLASISDEQFRQGMGRLRQFCDRQEQRQPVLEDLDLFVFRKSPR